MKKFRKNIINKQNKTSPKKSVDKIIVKNKKRNPFSGLINYIKRLFKLTLKNILLSKIFQKGFKIFVGILVISSLVYGLYAYFNKTFSNDVVVSSSEIVDRVAKLTPLPKDQPIDIKRVEDAETLKKQNVFFENVKNGDYIIIYPNLAVIYDLLNNNIVAIKKSGSE